MHTSLKKLGSAREPNSSELFEMKKLASLASRARFLSRELCFVRQNFDTLIVHFLAKSDSNIPFVVLKTQNSATFCLKISVFLV